LSFETVEEPIHLERQVLVKASSIVVPVIPLPPFQPSYLLSFTALSRGTEYELLDPLPEGDLPRGAETGVVIHRIFERIFSEKAAWKNRAHCSQIVHEELTGGVFSSWEEMVEKMVQDCLDLILPQGFCLRDLDPKFVRPEVEFVFADSPHFLKGFIDLVFVHEEKLYIVDWKTNWLKKYALEDLKDAIVAHKYDLQASIYAEALKHMGYNQANAIYLFVREPSVICFEPNEYHS
jgi:ATP-dependent exoDNAse (exonuclease V) beta subunit